MTRTTEGYRPEQRRKHRVFPWIFLGIQILFLVWIIVGANSAGSCPEGQEGACEVGTVIGAGLVIALWVAVDIILGLTYMVFRLLRR